VQLFITIITIALIFQLAPLTMTRTITSYKQDYFTYTVYMRKGCTILVNEC